MAGQRPEWSRRYPPLASALVAVLVAVFVLPSALNVPQSNPSQTLEFAPIPPEDEEPPPPDSGNVESLSLGSSSTAPGDALGGAGGLPTLLPPPATGIGDRPVTKRCVGTPPRQTEDPLSPPCVAHFDGDNFGSTHPGVSGEEIRILFYFDGSPPGTPRPTTSRGSEDIPGNEFFDLGLPPTDDEYVTVRQLRLLQAYFNDRYQTYGRTARFIVHFGDPADSPETRQADAVAGVTDWRPFAAIAFGRQNIPDYVNEMARSGVVNILGRDIIAYEGRAGRTETFHATFPGLVWSFDPSLDRRVDLFTTWACSKALPYPVSFSGNPSDLGQPRVFGLLIADDEDAPEANEYGAMIRDALVDCGVTFTETATVTSANSGLCLSPEQAIGALTTFQQRGVTTIIRAGGYETCFTPAAASINYRPEWLVAGDNVNDTNIYSRQQEPSVWSYARIITTNPFGGALDQEMCFVAQGEVDPATPRADARFGCGYYDELRQLFTGIQVAGPRLTPESVDRGFHAIPAIQTDDPRIPACFYRPGDYTCIKDAQVASWDPGGLAPGRSEPGCWRSMEGGRRYLPGDWRPGDVETQRTAQDPCMGVPAEELT